jgi:flagellar FliL protein
MADEQAAVPPKKSGGALGMVINGLGIFVLTLIAVVVGGFINARLHPQQELALDKEGRLTLKAPPEAAAGRKGGTKAGAPAVYYAFDPPIVVNFQQDGVVRFLQVTVDVMSRDPAAITAVQQNGPLIRNNLTMMMSDLDAAQVMSREGREALRAKALEEVRAILDRETGGKAVIEDLLFTSFVVQ